MTVLRVPPHRHENNTFLNLTGVGGQARDLRRRTVAPIELWKKRKKLSELHGTMVAAEAYSLKINSTG
jgi:hypothetical protein